MIDSSPPWPVGDIGGHGQPETGAAPIATAPFVEAHEATDHVGALIGWNAGAVVVDVYGDPGVAVAIDGHGDLGGGRRGGVGDEMIEGSSERSLITAHDHRPVRSGPGDGDSATA